MAPGLPWTVTLLAASLQGWVALGPRAGHPVRRLRSAAAVTATARLPWLVNFRANSSMSLA